MQDRKFLLTNILLVKRKLSSERSMELRELANSLMKKAVLKNDSSLAQIAVLCYASHKILTKEHVTKSGFWIEYKMNLMNSMEKAIKALQRNRMKEYEKALNSVGANLQRLDKKVGRYVQGFYDKAKVKYAADAYYYGLSLSQAAALTGVGVDDLQSFIGVTKQHELLKDKKGIKRRLEEFKESAGLVSK